MIRFSSPTPKRSTLIATSQNAWYPQTVFSYNCVCVCELIMTTSLHSTITHGRARNDKEIFGKASSTMQEFCRKKTLKDAKRVTIHDNVLASSTICGMGMSSSIIGQMKTTFGTQCWVGFTCSSVVILPRAP